MPLLRRRTLDRVTKDAFWNVVLDCLVDVFAVDRRSAEGFVLDRRTRVDLSPTRVRSDIFYHREPFDVARSLADGIAASPQAASLDDAATLVAYERILTRHGLA